MMRGLLQGWPKKLGQVWMTRSYDLEHPAAARRVPGQRLGASLAVKDRRLVNAEFTLLAKPGEKLGFLAMPTYGLLGTPSILEGAGDDQKRLVRSVVSASTIGNLQKAAGRLEFLKHPREELELLAPLGEVEASIGPFALTITGAREELQ